jgi:hypothetical protein
MSNIEIEVMDLLGEGVSIYSIARITELPVPVVEGILAIDPDYEFSLE